MVRYEVGDRARKKPASPDLFRRLVQIQCSCGEVETVILHLDLFGLRFVSYILG